MGFHLPTKLMIAPSTEPPIDGAVDPVHPVSRLGCNWLVPEEQEAYAGSVPGRFVDPPRTRRRRHHCPGKAGRTTTAIASDPAAAIGLPVEPFWRTDGGLAFDLLSSYSAGKQVTIGHANGVITIDLVESLDAYRESLRVRLGEPYRTMLGHFFFNPLEDQGQCRSSSSRASRVRCETRIETTTLVISGISARPMSISAAATIRPAPLSGT